MKLFRSLHIALMLLAASGVIVFVYNAIVSEPVFATETSSQDEAQIDTQHVIDSYIVQGKSISELAKQIRSVGGLLDKEFPIIASVSAKLSKNQAQALSEIPGLKVLKDRSVQTMSNSKRYAVDTYVTTQIDANEVHDLGITGRGVTVAVIDSGANMGGSNGKYLFADSDGEQRVAIKYDAIRGEESYYYNDDNNGHGSHVTGIIASSLQDASNDFNGVAPDVYLVSIKAFDEDGNSSYSSILDALNWVSDNRGKFNIKVLNLSLGAEAQSRYWNDPINQAVMHLWRRGITVVTSAGNNGKELGITVPGNNPYVITVGSTTYNGSPYNIDDDRVASFSAQGPTYEGFVKPDVVAPGANIEVKLESRYFKKSLKQSSRGKDYSVISGTSQSAAVVSGVAALIIQAYPGIRPDDVKCKIMHSAKMARSKNKYNYSPLIQGSGMVNAYDAIRSNAWGCANQGLSVRKDIEGKQHFVGPVNKKNNTWTVSLSNGKEMKEGSHWSNKVIQTNGSHWTEEIIKVEGSHWSTENIGMHGGHWSDELVQMKGGHWGSENVQTQSAMDFTDDLDNESDEHLTGSVPIQTEGWQ